VHKALYNTADSLMRKIMEVMESLHRDNLAITCRRSRKRIKAKMDAGGNFSCIN
jgi:hypothetical protein